MERDETSGRDFLVIDCQGEAPAPAAPTFGDMVQTEIRKITGIAPDTACETDPFWPPRGSTLRGRIEEEGRRAAMSGAWPAACPYRVKGSRARLAWLDGFCRWFAEGGRAALGAGNVRPMREDIALAARDVLAAVIAARVRAEMAEAGVTLESGSTP